jgi:cobalamin biosynthesis protein CobT
LRIYLIGKNQGVDSKKQKKEQNEIVEENDEEDEEEDEEDEEEEEEDEAKDNDEDDDEDDEDEDEEEEEDEEDEEQEDAETQKITELVSSINVQSNSSSTQFVNDSIQYSTISTPQSSIDKDEDEEEVISSATIDKSIQQSSLDDSIESLQEVKSDLVELQNEFSQLMTEQPTPYTTPHRT